MIATVRRRGRIARVRGIQHLAAVGAAATADAHVAALESSSSRLAELRGLLLDEQAHGHGMALASAHELASRLDRARDGLTDAIVGARAAVVERERQRLAARIDQEGAERLQARAASALDALIERRAGLAPRRLREDEA